MFHRLYLAAALLSLGCVAGQPVQLIAVLPNTTVQRADGPDGYYPLASGLESALRLAVEDVNANATLGVNTSLSLSLVRADGLSPASTLKGVCEAADAGNATYGVVGPLFSADASLLGEVSSLGLSLPIVSYAAPTAAPTPPGEEGNFLFRSQPDIYLQMEALASLIMDMKRARDTAFYGDGACPNAFERVVLLHSTDDYGSRAAEALWGVAHALNASGPGLDEAAAAAGLCTGAVGMDIVTSVSLPSRTEWQRAGGVADMAAEVMEEMERLMATTSGMAVMILLVQGYDGVLVRTVLQAAREVGMASNTTQWYLGDAAALDDVFDANASYRDSQLAYDLRGTLAVRPCLPTSGPGALAGAQLTSRWLGLDPLLYPGAGAGSLSSDGRLEPLYGFAYDSVLAMASAVAAQLDADGVWPAPVAPGSCPFGDAWPAGEGVRQSLAAGAITGVTGTLDFVGADQSQGAAGGVGGRWWNDTAMCVVNLQAHHSLGASFVELARREPYNAAGASGATSLTTLPAFQPSSEFVQQTYPGGAVGADASLYPRDRPSMSGQTVSVVVLEGAAPFIFVEGSASTGYSFSGLSIHFLEQLAQALNFDYTITGLPANVSTNDMIAMVQDGLFDMAISAVTITSTRLDVVQFSYPYYDLGAVLVYKVENAGAEVDMLSLFKPFSWQLWAMVVANLLVVVALFWLFEGRKNDDFSGFGASSSSVKRSAKALARTMYVSMALLLQQLTHKPETLEGYILTIGWMFTAFIIGATYTAELASFLTVKKASDSLVTASKLANGEIPHSEVILKEGTTLVEIYERDICGGECVGDYQLCETVDDCVTAVLEGTAAATLYDLPTIEYGAQRDWCGVAWQPELFQPQGYGIVLPASTAPEVLSEFEKATLALRENGDITSTADDLFSGGSCDTSSATEESDERMSLLEMGGLFVIMAVFIGIALACWVWRMHKKHSARRHAGKTHRGSGGAGLLGETEAEGEVFHDRYKKLSRTERKRLVFKTLMAVEDLQQQLVQVKKERGEDVDAGALERSHRAAATMAAQMAALADDSTLRHNSSRDHIASGRPVVRLAGSLRNLSTSDQSFSGLSFNENGSLRRQATRRHSIPGDPLSASDRGSVTQGHSPPESPVSGSDEGNDRDAEAFAGAHVELRSPSS